MFCSAVRYSRKLKPTVHQTVASTTEIIAVFGSCSQAMGSIPTQPRTVFTSPSCGFSIHTQNRSEERRVGKERSSRWGAQRRRTKNERRQRRGDRQQTE